MQTSEIAGRVQQSPRRPHGRKARPAQHKASDSRVQEVGANESRHRAAREPATRPHSYGAGY